MASKLQTFNIKSLVGGLNVYANPTQVKDNESPDLLNVVFTGISSVRDRQGFIKLVNAEVATGHKIQGIFSYITSTISEILYVSNTKLYKYNGSGGSTEVTGGTFHATNHINAAQIGTRLYFADGSSDLQYYDGTNIVKTGIVAAPSKPTQIIYYNRRIYVTSSDYKDRVYYGGPVGADGVVTSTGDFTADTDSGYYSLPGRRISGFARQSTSMYVFSRNSLDRIDPVSGTTLDHSQTLISSSLGCISPRSIENVENDIYFLSNTIYSLGEVARYVTVRTTNVSGKVKGIFDNMSQEAMNNVSCYYYAKEEMFLVSLQVGTGNNNRILALQIPYQAWTLWDGMSVNHFVDYTDVNNVKHLYFGSDDSTKSYIYELFQGNSDDGLAINKYYKTAEFDLKQFNIEKIFQNYNVQFGGVYGILTIEFYVNGVLVDTANMPSGSSLGTSDGMGTQTLGTFTLGLEGWFEETSLTASTVSSDWRWHTLNTSPDGTTFQMVFKNSTLGEGFEIRQISVGYLTLPYFKREATREI